MNTHADKTQENKSQSVANEVSQKQIGGGFTFQFVDNRPEAIAQRKLQEMVNNSPQAKQAAQLQAIANNHATQQQQLIQRKVTINDRKIDSVVDYLVDNDLDIFLSVEESIAAGWMLGLSPTWNFKGPEDLLLYTNKVHSLANLIKSIFSTGILSRSELEKQEIGYTGSEDVGSKGGLAVNVLDMRTEANNAEAISKESMSVQDRGSISVALERRDDWVKQEELVKSDEIVFTESEMISFQKKYDENLGMLLPTLKLNKAAAINEELMAELLNSEMQDRAMNTIMAVVPNPNGRIANLSERSASYESDVPSGKIPVGDGGFTSLLIPEWFQPFYLMIEDLQPPNITVRFVGTKTITANYKTRNGHIPVTLNAPDYGSEISPLLQEFKLLATHILTA